MEYRRRVRQSSRRGLGGRRSRNGSTRHEHWSGGRMRISFGAVARSLYGEAIVQDLVDLGMLFVVVIAFLKLFTGDVMAPEHLLVKPQPFHFGVYMRRILDKRSRILIRLDHVPYNGSHLVYR